MLVSASLYTRAIPNNNTNFKYSIPDSGVSGPVRSDVQVTFNACYYDSASQQYQIYVTVSSTSPSSPNATKIQTEGTLPLYNTAPKGFALGTGIPGYTKTSAVFVMVFDAADNFPENIQVHLGPQGGGGKTPNTGYKFAKSKIVRDDEEESK